MSLENVYPTQPTTVTSEPAFEFQAFGTVVDDQEATMHSLPHTEATIRAHLPANGTFAIVARDQPGNWLEVVYASTTGELRHGWLKAICARQVEKEGRAVRLLDIRISQFENNSRDDLAELIRRKSGRVKGFLLLLTVVGLLACLGGAGVGFGGGQPAVGAAGVVGVLLLLGAIVILARALPSKIEMKWLQSLRRGKQSTSQNLREDATRIATRTALIGGTFLVAKIGLDAYLKSQPKKTQSQIDINYRGRS